MNPKKSIFLVRHGSTQFNEMDLLQGQGDMPLCSRGRQEAEALAEKLKEAALDVIFQSPLKRAQETASIINQFHQAPVETIGSFREIQMGEWEGQKYSEVIVREKAFHQQWQKNPNLGFPGGESFQQVFDRVQPGVMQVLQSSQPNQMIVGHATVNRAILGHLLQMNIQAARVFRMKNAAFSKFLVYDNPYGDLIVLDFWNNDEHLTALKRKSI